MCLIQNHSIIYDFVNNCDSPDNMSGVDCEGEKLSHITKFNIPKFKTECVPMNIQINVFIEILETTGIIH